MTVSSFIPWVTALLFSWSLKGSMSMISLTPALTWTEFSQLVSSLPSSSLSTRSTIRSIKDTSLIDSDCVDQTWWPPGRHTILHRSPHIMRYLVVTSNFLRDKGRFFFVGHQLTESKYKERTERVGGIDFTDPGLSYSESTSSLVNFCCCSAAENLPARISQNYLLLSSN